MFSKKILEVERGRLEKKNILEQQEIQKDVGKHLIKEKKFRRTHYDSE